ncbi:MAG: hypothetical protein ABSF53_20605, partial [Terracidiphilus sp.]
MNIKRISKMLLLSASIALASSALAQSEDDSIPQPGPTTLTLINGWTNAPYATSDAEVELVNGIVHFKGAIAGGKSSEAFVLPPEFRPSSYVYIPIDLYYAQNGRLVIYPTGEVVVEAQNSFSNAVNFTSLDGASFALNSSGFKSLTLLNGWQDYGAGVAKAEVKNVNGIVHLKGAIAGGSNDEPFVLPSGFRPAKLVYVPVDLTSGTNGRLVIYPDGLVYVEAEGNSFGDAQGFTSLDGAWFVAKDSGFDKLSLTNGWTDYESGTGQAKAKIVNGIVYFQGAISTSGN